MIYITIDNDINNLPQSAIFAGLHWIPDVKQVVLKVKYGVYQNNQFTYGFKELIMVADNTTFVDPSTGLYVPEGTENAIGEYDFFVALISSELINISGLIQSYMNRARQQGRYI